MTEPDTRTRAGLPEPSGLSGPVEPSGLLEPVEPSRLSVPSGLPGHGTGVRPDGPHAGQEAELAPRNRMLARAAVSSAQDILRQRYGLPSAQAGFELLREASQRHNVKLHTLADAVIRVPCPDHERGVWFPGRARTSAPPLPRIPLAGHSGDAATQGSVLSGALTRVLEITQTGMGNVQLAEHGLLRLEKHTGLSRQFTDFFAFVDHPSTSCAQAAQDREQVTVRDVATEPFFDEGSRRVILHAGSRACHSVPLLNERGAVLGVISSHHPQPLTGYSRTRLEALRTTAATVGRWLSWHRRTVVLDALEDLHFSARRKRGDRDAARTARPDGGAVHSP
ncbi:GAF and ANTAR domain-containing protein [Streptomyces naganishii]|uniref:GAF and ANTAR domain-containing protein n=1 Tax=Streptomyces naganishii TaxID=285447 RepID=UPI0036B20920